jgi:hypothetical protein
MEQTDPGAGGSLLTGERIPGIIRQTTNMPKRKLTRGLLLGLVLVRANDKQGRTDPTRCREDLVNQWENTGYN